MGTIILVIVVGVVMLPVLVIADLVKRGMGSGRKRRRR